ncbi:MAG: extracellular solute-binding protein [Rhodospirillaceae bacterium]|nr:extracellular solute-binding protein [Rhodospirillaceae bacterium]MBT5245773.1 extracellular solute-binding protein [Rhodospirillaceae bacterium]MBT5561616.1 extracellular solute-binding protein [Rhodospirillaceae bacterium]MBT6241788.1 extracellular solute-binding protein [Rhodospirillaceae bacterium]MBT7136788.1 extracellular solute-binding protein [Rhodospirillaceae bacterium]
MAEAAAAMAKAKSMPLKVTNWAEYIDEENLKKFEAEYGIKVIYDTYESAEAIDAKLLAGDTGYDVILHAAGDMARLIKAGGILQPLDKSKIDNLKHLDPALMSQMASDWDPGNKYFVPFMWGTHGVTYNKELVLETYPGAPIGSMDLIFDPAHIEKVAKCGVSMLDSPGDVIPMALASIGLDPNSTNPDDYKKVGEMLAKIRPFIKTFDNYAYQKMPQKEFCIAVTWGPDGLLAMSGAAEANTGVVLDFFLPEGQNKAQLWIDGWIIPADAKNVIGAHLFLDFFSRPEVGAADSNFTWYATANKTGKSMVDEEVTSSPAAFPTSEQVAKMYTTMVLPPKIERLQTRTWTDFKAGN